MEAKRGTGGIQGFCILARNARQFQGLYNHGYVMYLQYVEDNSANPLKVEKPPISSENKKRNSPGNGRKMKKFEDFRLKLIK